MRSVAEITGQDALAQRIHRAFEGGARTVALAGSEGSGKSQTAAIVAALANSTHRAVVRRGELLLRKSPEAMLVGVKSSDQVGKTTDALMDVAEDVAELIQDGSIPFSRTLRRLFGMRKAAGKKRILTERQQAFLYELAAVRDKRSVLLIADNLHYWDEESFTFLAQVQQGFWDEEYPGLKRVRVLLIWTPDQAAKDFPQLVSIAFGKGLRTEELKQVPVKSFGELLSALGGPADLPREVIDQAYAVAGGHLLFASQLVALLRESGAASASSLANGADAGEALKNMIEARLDAVGPASTILRRLLQALCIVGEGAGRTDLACVLPEADDNLEAIIEQAKRLGLVTGDHTTTSVVHEIVRRVFLQFLTPDEMAWHKRFASCLVKLRPSDYDRRAVHLEAAGLGEPAATARVMALLSAVRGNRILPEQDWISIAGPLSEVVAALVETLRRANLAESKRDYAGAIRIVEEGAVSADPVLLAERDAYLARLLLLVRTHASQERALSLLEEHPSFRTTEPDLWARIEELKIILLQYLGRIPQARHIESALRAFYQERSAYDPSAQFGENRLRRKSEAIHSPRIANDRLKRALLFLDPAGDGLAPRDLVEYALTLNNLGANELVVGDFDSAYRHLTKCFQLIQRSDQLVVRRVEIVLSNVVVAHYLHRNEAPPELELLGDLVREVDVSSSDGCLVRSNIGGLLVATGSGERGLALLRDTASEVSRLEGFSAYSRYFLYSNVATAVWSAGEDPKSWLALADLAASQIEPDLEPYAKRRLAMLRDAFNPIERPDMQSLNAHFASAGPQVGEGWRLYGRSVALSDLQFWTES